MNRPIKFRLHSKPAKKYVDYITIGFSKSGELRMYSTENGAGPVLEDNYIVEQFTGLTDKNGAEVYESDIVRVVRSYGYGFLPKGAKAVVEFDEKELCYKLRGQGEYRLTANKEVEVIGNIHENKELWNPEVRNPKERKTNNA